MTFSEFLGRGKDGKRRAKPMSDRDISLILVSFTAIFGILHYRLLYEAPNTSLWNLLLSVIFVCFWLGIAFSCGRRLSRGFYVTSAVIWGASLLFYLLNATLLLGTTGFGGGFFGTLASYVMFGLMMIAVATVLPLVPGLASLGWYPRTPSALLVMAAVMILLIAAAFFLGFFFDKRRSGRSSAK